MKFNVNHTFNWSRRDLSIAPIGIERSLKVAGFSRSIKQINSVNTKQIIEIRFHQSQAT